MREPRDASTAPGARQLAAQVLHAVLNRGVFASATLDRVLRSQPTLDTRDRALTTELVYGTLRTVKFLDSELMKLAPRGKPSGAPEVRVHLLLAAYQLLFLDRVPAFAAVDSAVTAITKLGDTKVGGFANAVLRKLAKRPRPSLDEALIQNAPDWLWQEMQISVGLTTAKALLGAAAESASPAGSAAVTPSSLRLRRGVSPPGWLEQQAERGRVYPPAYLLRRAGDLQQTPEWERGQYVVQEEGAMLCGAALGARPGDKVLDACAGRGQKSSLLAESIGAQGELWATDVSQAKLDVLQGEFTRLSLPPPHTTLVDWSDANTTTLPRDFDRILVDAPCTGTGTLRRRPEICLRLKPKDAERLANTSESMLRQVAQLVRPTGRVLFVVCSVLRRECETVVERLSDIYTEVPFDADLPLLHGNTRLRLLPDIHGTDGFFLACLQPRP